MNVEINARTIAFIVLTALLCGFSLVLSCGTYELWFPVSGLADDVGELNIDGADFTPLVELGATVFEGLLKVAFGLIFFALVTVVCCVAFLIMRLVSVRRTSAVTVDELNLSQIALWSLTGTFFLLAQILTRFQMAWYVGLLFWQIPAFGHLFQIWGLRRVLSGGLKIDIPIHFI